MKFVLHLAYCTTGLVDLLRLHPIREMMKTKLRVVLSSDDPDLFFVDLEQEFSMDLVQCGLCMQDLWHCQIEGYVSIFIPYVQKKEKWYRTIKKWEHSKNIILHS